MSHERFKMLRRNSLKVECPEGVWDEFEELEDRFDDDDNVVSHSECMMLQRALSDKTKMPKVCMGENGMVNTSAGSTAMVTPAARMPELVRRLTGAVPGAFNTDPMPSKKQMLGGHVTLGECQTLHDFLAPSVGGSYMLPTACSKLLKRAEEQESEEAERDNERVFARLKRRMSQVAQEDYPPTFV